jgi:tetratricopeptide (TPR) repeat protein
MAGGFVLMSIWSMCTPNCHSWAAPLTLIRHAVFVFTFLSALVLASHPSGASSIAESGCLAANVNSVDRVVLQNAIEVCSAALEDTTTSNEIRAEMLQQRGVALRNSGLLERSLSDLSDALALFPRNSGLLRMRAWSLRESGKPEAAEKDYDLALQLEPEWQGFLSRCVVRIDQGNFADALSDCEKSLQLQRLADGLFFSAYALKKMGRMSEALPKAIAACEQSDSIAEHFVLLAEIQRDLGLHGSAKSTVKAALEKFPNDSLLKASFSKLGL